MGDHACTASRLVTSDVAPAGGSSTLADEDAYLVEGVRRRSRKAFLTLVNRFHNQMVRLAMLSDLDALAAQKLVERTWLDVVERIDECDSVALQVWVFRLLLGRLEKSGGSASRSGPRRSSVDGHAVDPKHFMRPGTRWPGHWGVVPPEWGDFSTEGTGSARARDVVQQSVEGLPLEVRRVIALRDIEGWTSRDVSDLFGITAGDQVRLLHQGRTCLRRDLDDVLRS